MPKRTHFSGDEGEVSGAEQRMFSPSKRRQLGGEGDTGDANSVTQGVPNDGGGEHSAGADGELTMVDTDARDDSGDGDGVEAAEVTYQVVQEEPTDDDDDDGDAFRADLELSAVFADDHHHATAEVEGVVQTAGADPEETSEATQRDQTLGAADDYNNATAVAETNDTNGDRASLPMVIAPMFPPVHCSWEAFEHSLKEYTQATFQQYVIRTTTSVKRRNQRITDNASSSLASALIPVPGASSENQLQNAPPRNNEDGLNADVTDQEATLDEQPEPEDDDASSPSALVSGELAQGHAALSDETVVTQQQLIPESYQWYSKTLMCTHGWKDRNRRSGKRSLSVVRSTSCPAKMCVTLQHRGKGDDGWQVVLTRHVRTHNHQLSKELYLYYMENRRIYDPDLLQVVVADGLPSASPSPNTSQQQQQQQRSKSGLSHLLANSEDQQAPQPTDNKADVALSGFQAPRALVKAHETWEQFHKYVVEYSTLSNQSFRSRSTVSVAAKNLKIKTLALKAGRSAEDTAAHLIPESERWYSKMLICNHGWKRKSRSKAQKNNNTTAQQHQDDELGLENSCPAMLMARLQRDVNDTWRVVINRQVLDHNHSPLRLVVTSDMSAGSSSLVGQRAALSSAATVEQQQQQQQESSSQQSLLHYFGEDLTGNLSSSQDHIENGAVRDQQQQPERVEIVVRVPKLEPVHESWEAFHARLQEYSDATFQLYRTRTTSSVLGRNQKIPEMKRSSSSSDAVALDEADNVTTQPPQTDTRTIPEEWKWYSKTLTCTHGWKERRRGTGKRTVQVFRSTACPVKICATVQFVENTFAADDGAGGDEANRGGGSWRVVVTKHVVDHNHNLSKELHQHYCENRRIYDPDLLTIDESNASAVTKPRKIPQQHHNHNSSFLLGGSEDQHAFHPHGAQAATTGMSVTPAAGNVLQHPLAFQGDSSLHPGGHLATIASNCGGHDFHFGAADHGSFSTHPGSFSTLQAQGGLSASLSSFSGAFPSLPAGSRALFRNASQPQNPPFHYQAGQYFALDQSVNLGLAASQLQMPFFITNPGSREGVGSTNALSYAVGTSNSTSSFLAAPCRVHSVVGMQLAQRQHGIDQQCTCYRGAHGSVTKPRAAQPQQRNAISSAPLPRSAAKQKRSSTDQRLLQDDDQHHDHHQHDNFDNDDEDEDEGASLGGSTAVWVPTLDPEIVTLTSVTGVIFYRAPKIKRLHATWDAFQEHLEAYSVATFQLFRVRTTSSVSSRNTRIAQQAVDRDVPTPLGALEGGGGLPPPGLVTPSPLLVPESYQWYSKTFVCTHGWKSRSRGKGQRVSHNLRSTACPSKLCVTLQRVLHETNKWHVVVTRQGTDHNHEISVVAYQQYSEVRRIRDASLLEQAEELWKKGLTRRKVFEFLKEQAPNILMKDVHNLVQRWQTRHGKMNSDTGDLASAAESVTASQEDASMQHELSDI